MSLKNSATMTLKNSATMTLKNSATMQDFSPKSAGVCYIFRFWPPMAEVGRVALSLLLGMLLLSPYII
jgi:hypothetical protein